MSEQAAQSLQGPWEQAFALRVPLTLRSKSNFRRHRSGVTSGQTWTSAREFERSLGVLVRAARPDGWVLGSHDDPVDARPVVVAFVAARSTVDVANYPKSIVDACENVLYVSDASVLGISCVGARGRSDELVVAFARLLPACAPRTVSAAVSELSSRTLARFPGFLPDPA